MSAAIRPLADADLERRISQVKRALDRETSFARRRVLCDELGCLIKQRSPAQVQRMELARGLR